MRLDSQTLNIVIDSNLFSRSKPTLPTLVLAPEVYLKYRARKSVDWKQSDFLMIEYWLAAIPGTGVSCGSPSFAFYASTFNCCIDISLLVHSSATTALLKSILNRGACIVEHDRFDGSAVLEFWGWLPRLSPLVVIAASELSQICSFGTKLSKVAVKFASQTRTEKKLPITRAAVDNSACLAFYANHSTRHGLFGNFRTLY